MNLALLQQTADIVHDIVEKNAHEFETIDPYGVGMAIIGISVVFAALFFLYLIFLNLAKILQINVNRSLRKEGKSSEIQENPAISSEVNAAIALAIYMLNAEAHDKESEVLTINKISRTYSPWSSKIYGLRQYPR